MRLAFISTILGYPFGGADRLWAQTAAAAIAQGHPVFLALSSQTAQHPEVLAMVRMGAALHIRREHTQYQGRVRDWRRRIENITNSEASLTVALRKFSPDLVVMCQGGTFDYLVEDGLCAWLLKHERIGTVLISQSSDTNLCLPADRQAGAQSLAQWARRFIFVSTHNRQMAEQQLGFALPNAEIVHNPVCISFATPLAWPSTPPYRFAVVSRLENRHKGLDLLIPGLAMALGQHDDWTLSVFGRGPDEPALRAMARSCGLADRVSFRGHRSDLRAIWAEHHMLVLPSRREGCSLAMLEALQCGRPVLATDVGGVSDWIRSGTNGFVCPECSAEALARTLREAWEVRSHWAAMGRAAHSASAQFDPHPGRSLLRILQQAS